MITSIMIDWLDAFYRHIGDRKVILAMDNFSAHISGMSEAQPPANVQIIWLPANSTSHFQPLDQGIIQNLKIHYKKQWLQFIINQFEQDADPYKMITVFHAIKWTIKAWNNEVENSTIAGCFRKSTIIQPSIQNLPLQPAPNLDPLYEQAIQVARIQDAMSLNHFLNPVDENEFEASITPQTLEGIIQYHIGQPDEEEILEDVEPLPEIIPTHQEALFYVQNLLKWEENSDQAKTDEIRLLERLEKKIQRLRIDSQQQTTLEGWLM